MRRKTIEYFCIFYFLSKNMLLNEFIDRNGIYRIILMKVYRKNSLNIRMAEKYISAEKYIFKKGMR